mmetsp:Transcript_39374/g.103876  ORF Transcript_39374/g.103876 Transcript_39374/m.103876 type:complete len:302 (+) Transcript_39374:918-1823(+)
MLERELLCLAPVVGPAERLHDSALGPHADCAHHLLLLGYPQPLLLRHHHPRPTMDLERVLHEHLPLEESSVHLHREIGEAQAVEVVGLEELVEVGRAQLIRICLQRRPVPLRPPSARLAVTAELATKLALTDRLWRGWRQEEVVVSAAVAPAGDARARTAVRRKGRERRLRRPPRRGQRRRPHLLVGLAVALRVCGSGIAPARQIERFVGPGGDARPRSPTPCQQRRAATRRSYAPVQWMGRSGGRPARRQRDGTAQGTQRRQAVEWCGETEQQQQQQATAGRHGWRPTCPRHTRGRAGSV